MEIGCDPATKDKSGKVPYNYAESRECRDIFRKFMGQYPDKYDYKKVFKCVLLTTLSILNDMLTNEFNLRN